MSQIVSSIVIFLSGSHEIDEKLQAVVASLQEQDSGATYERILDKWLEQSFVSQQEMQLTI